MVFVLAFVCFADVDAALADYRAHRYAWALQKFESCVHRDPNDARRAEVLYYLGLLQADPEAAQGYFQQVMDFYPASSWAEPASLNHSKIDYALSNHLDALAGFNRFLRDHPRSQFRAEVLYWLGRCSLALNDRLSADRSLTELTTTFAQSPWARRAGDRPAEKTSAPALAPAKPLTVQVGSFQSKTNAQSLATKLRTLGYDVEVKEAQVQSVTYFRVWVGSYTDAGDAAPTLESLKARGISGTVVKR